jgi:membrane protease YdiL (CAAX protease family)
MFIAQVFNYKHDAWRYLIGGFIIFTASQLGSLPLLGAVMFKLLSEGGSLADLEDTAKLMTILDSNLTLFLMLFSFAVGLLGVYIVVKYLHNQPMVAVTTSRKKIDWGRFFFGFMLIAITTVFFTGLDYYSNPEDFEIQFQLVPFLILAVIAILMIPLQTSFEEYFFRGYLMQGIGALAKNKWVPLLITSFVFGGLHFFNPEVDKLGNIVMIYYIGTGLFLGIITLMDEGIELALGFHAGNNLVASLLVTADWTVFQTNSILKDVSEPSAGIDVLGPVLIIYPTFIAIMAYKYKWKDWGNKLFGRIEAPPLETEEITL